METFSIKHDLHCHSFLSACCKDPQSTTENIFRLAHERGYDTLCLTNHLWDAPQELAIPIYQGMTIEHLRKALPFPQYPGLHACFGCETEYAAGVFSLQPKHVDMFDFILLSANHMHLFDFVRPRNVNSPQRMADFLVERLEYLVTLDLPYERVGISHLTVRHLYPEGNVLDVLHALNLKRLGKVFDRVAHAGSGIELNSYSFARFAEDPEAYLAIYGLAKKAGCKFFCGSDAHSLPEFSRIEEVLPPVIEALELTEKERYIIPYK